jgi:WD40 repeat protein
MIKQSKLFLVMMLVTIMVQKVSSWCLKTQFADSMRINSIDFSRDGSKIVTASDSFRVTVWDAHTLEQLHV